MELPCYGRVAIQSGRSFSELRDSAFDPGRVITRFPDVFWMSWVAGTAVSAGGFSSFSFVVAAIRKGTSPGGDLRLR
jgi:hypothetical protein